MKTLFGRQLAILLVVTLVFAGLSVALSDLATRTIMSWTIREDTTGGPTGRHARLINELTGEGGLNVDEAVARVNKADFGPMRARALKAEELTTLGVSADEVPQDPQQAHPVREEGDSSIPPRAFVFRSAHDPNRFLVFEFHHRGGPRPGMGPGPRGGRPPGPPLFVWTFAALIASGFLAATISLFFLFSSMRRKAREAGEVIAAIKKGEWHKRMPIDRLDEVGHLMQEFNRMADEIESAVKSMQRAEASRTNLLQELAHDLRTPVASLRGLIETLEMRGENLNAAAKGELFGLAQKEIDYFGRLVEDLLFLAQVRDPRYFNSGKPVDLRSLVEDEIERVSHDRKIKVRFTQDQQAQHLVRGDEVLLKRLLRNAIENALSFARSEIEISLQKNQGELSLLIRDDGPGFSSETLAHFGEKRFSRFLGSGDQKASGERLSVGLGSVIMSTVAAVHGGKVTARNAPSRQGAELEITLPLS